MGKRRGHKHGKHGHRLGWMNFMNPLAQMTGPTPPGWVPQTSGIWSDPWVRSGLPPMSSKIERHLRREQLSSSSSSSSSTSESSTDSETKCMKKWNKQRNKQMKRWQKVHKLITDPNRNKSQCTLCWRQIRPLVDTDVLECGHLFHLLCLKELINISQKGENPEVFCTQCHQQVDKDLLKELENKVGPKIGVKNGHTGLIGHHTTGHVTTHSTTGGMVRDMQDMKLK